MMRDDIISDSLPTNLGKGGMKKFIDDKLGRISSVHLRDAKTYSIQAAQIRVGASPKANQEVMIREAQTIKNLRRWDDPLESTTIRAYLESKNGEEEP